MIFIWTIDTHSYSRATLRQTGSTSFERRTGHRSLIASNIIESSASKWNGFLVNANASENYRFIFSHTSSSAIEVSHFVHYNKLNFLQLNEFGEWIKGQRLMFQRMSHGRIACRLTTFTIAANKCSACSVNCAAYVKRLTTPSAGIHALSMCIV